MPKKISDVKVREVITSYIEGNSTHDVSKLTGVSQTQVRRILKKNNINVRKTKTSEDIEKQICALYNLGESSEKIATHFKIDGTTVCRIIKRNGLKIRSGKINKRKLNLEVDWFDVINTEEKAYFLGFLFSDGNVSKRDNAVRLNLQKEDKDILYTFAKLLYPNENLDERVKPDRNGFYVCAYSKDMKKALLKHGCTEAKTFNLNLPMLNDYLFRHFVRGFFDGDGCLNITNGTPSLIITGQKSFLSELKKKIKELSSTTWPIYDAKNGAELRARSFKTVKILIHWMYDESTIFLQRKKNTADIVLTMCNDKLKPPLKYGTTNIISYHGNKLTHSYVSSLKLDEKLVVANFLFDYFRKQGFPFDKYDDVELRDDFEKLKRSNVGFSDGELSTNLMSGKKIFKHFFPQYYSVKSKSKPSMLEAFKDDELLLKVIKNRLGLERDEHFNITGNMIKQGMRNSYVAFSPSVFNPVIAKAIYDEFAPDRASVLDISAGFGQRFLGAAASKKVFRYTGLDPWSLNIESLYQISKFLGETGTFYEIGSENFCTNEQFDFCFSSPPFFDKEIYAEEPTQASFEKNEEEFLNLWWSSTIKNVYASLKDGCLFVLNMDSNLFDKMHDFCYGMFTLTDTYYVKYRGKNNMTNDSFYILKKK